MSEIKVSKQKLFEIHDEFKEDMIQKYIDQFSETEIMDIFNEPKTFLSWCLRNKKAVLVERRQLILLV